MGVATVTSDARLLDEPVVFRGREFAAAFTVSIDGVAPPHEGVELGRYAGKLDALPDAATWSVRLRRSLVPLSDADARMLTGELDSLLASVHDQLAAYLVACKVPTGVSGPF